jgi:hypothetical protein
MVFLYDNAELFTMIKQIGLIAIEAMPLTLVIAGTNVEARDTTGAPI